MTERPGIAHARLKFELLGADIAMRFLWRTKPNPQVGNNGQRMATVDENNGFDAQALAVAEHMIVLELSLDEANALRAWLLKPAADGSTALDEALVNTSLKKLAGSIDKIEAVSNIRRELEEAGFDTTGMEDEQLVELGRKIGQASSRSLR
ncbi:MAG TPA: hypothetical protein VH817_23880 [Thermoleophilaceae bacterium]